MKSMDQPKPKIFSPGDISFRARNENPDVLIHDLVLINPLLVGCDLLKSLHLRFLVRIIICQVCSENNIPSAIMGTLLCGGVSTLWACPCT